VVEGDQATMGMSIFLKADDSGGAGDERAEVFLDDDGVPETLWLSRPALLCTWLAPPDPAAVEDINCSECSCCPLASNASPMAPCAPEC